jgi:GT2 family glycosyltransferase/MoaA/NifB/PqqE/SkfB family radical SAM enzyme
MDKLRTPALKEIGVIIVSHNNQDILTNCINSIKNQSYKKINIYLLDNDSEDGTAEFIKKNYPLVKFLDLPKKGPSEKRNIGIAESKSEYLVFMDSDTQLTKNWIKIAVRYMDAQKNVGLCGGKILRSKGLIDSAGGIIARNGNGTDEGAGNEDLSEYNNFKRVGYLKSASMIARRSMLTEIGGFDKDYFFGAEDTDLGLRANISGWKVVYNPELISYHLGHHTMKKLPRRKEFFRDKRNNLLTFFKNYEKATIIKYSPLLFFDFIYTLFSKKNGIEIFRAHLWNLINLNKTLDKRRNTQKLRKIKDSKLFDSINVPLLIRTRNFQNKYLDFIKGVRKKEIGGLTFFITTKCNSRCKHCFYWKNLNKTKDLKLDEIELMLSKFYNISSILLSGGEPFIRKDLVEIVDIIIKYTNAKLISIPSNCLMGEKIKSDMKKMLTKHPKVNFAIDCSLDGFEKTHDNIRGVVGGFDKTINLIKELNNLRTKYPNFKFLTVNTVITQQNMKDLNNFVEFVKTLNLSDHFFDLMRGDHPGKLSQANKENLKKINTIRYKTRKYYNAKKHKNILKKIFSDLRDRHVIITQMEVLDGGKWPFKCDAGTNGMILESDGSLRICELQPKVGSLLKEPVEELLKNKKSRKIMKLIRNHKCDCTHICNVSSSMGRDMTDLLFNRPFLDFFKKNKYFS